MTRSLPFRLLQHRCVGEGATPFPGLLHFTLDPYLILLSVKQGGIKYHFLSLSYDELGLNQGLPGHCRRLWVNNRSEFPVSLIPLDNCMSLSAVKEHCDFEKSFLLIFNQSIYLSIYLSIYPILFIFIYLSIRRRWWCNIYCHWTWIRQIQFKSWKPLVAFHVALIPLGKVWIQLSTSSYWKIVGQNGLFNLGKANGLEDGKLEIQTC